MSDTLQLVLLLAVGVPAAALIPFLAVKVFTRPESDVYPTPARRLSTVIILALLACAAISLALEGLHPGMQVFESFGAAKRYGLPITYVLVAAAVLIPFAHKPAPGVRAPFWWWALAGIIAVSTLASWIYPRQDLDVIDAAQGLALTAGLLLMTALGFRAVEWSEAEKWRLIATLSVAAVLSQISGISLGPFVALIVPVSAGMVYVGLRTRKMLLVIGGIAIAVALYIRIKGTYDPSIAVLTQIAACVGVFALLLLPRLLRHIVAVVGLIAAVILSYKSGLFKLMSGDGRGVTDVTLTHRAYEAYVVWQQMIQDPMSVIVGLGPAATVNLVNSPDARTLRSAGRDLFAVDDVHFLTSWALLKFGLLGLVWLFFLIAAVVREAIHILNQRKPDPFDAFLLMAVAAGTVTALPAATNIFANPMLGLFLGILYARRKTARGQESEPLAPSRLPRYAHVRNGYGRAVR